MSVRTSVTVPAGTARLAGDLAVPEGARGVVLFAHGSGSGRHSPRNRQVAAALGQAGLATLLLDLLTEEEEAVDRDRAELRFDIALLAGRLMAAMDWLAGDPRTSALPIGLFGASTGAAAALVAAAERPLQIAAVVSRGGRPDLAGPSLGLVRAPTLLVVGGRDRVVLELNRSAAEQLGVEQRLEIVPDATHLFEEPGALERVAALAADWFRRWLAPDTSQNGQAGHSKRSCSRATASPRAGGGTVEHPVCDDADTLAYLANLGVVTLHSWTSRVAHLEQPDRARARASRSAPDSKTIHRLTIWTFAVGPERASRPPRRAEPCWPSADGSFLRWRAASAVAHRLTVGRSLHRPSPPSTTVWPQSKGGALDPPILWHPGADAQ